MDRVFVTDFGNRTAPVYEYCFRWDGGGSPIGGRSSGCGSPGPGGGGSGGSLTGGLFFLGDLIGAFFG
jgi:hypothetical protein